jgi:hypothetical protein
MIYNSGLEFMEVHTRIAYVKRLYYSLETDRTANINTIRMMNILAIVVAVAVAIVVDRCVRAVSFPVGI